MCLASLALSLFLLTGAGSSGEKVEYVRLPLLTFDADTPPPSPQVKTPEPLENVKRVVSAAPVILASSSRAIGVGSSTSSNHLITELINNMTSTAEEASAEAEEDEATQLDVDEATHSEVDEEAEDGEEEDDDDDEFSELDLIDLVQALERQADLEERSGAFPEILDILHGKLKQPSTTTTTTSTVKPIGENYTRIGVNSEGDLELGSEDLSDFSEEIIEGISEGVEESLRMSDLEMDEGNTTRAGNATEETRQFSVYLFQGQYYAEPRLNRFIDGALRNMGTELRVASMDPLYFRVLPRGQVAEREQPLVMSGASGVRRRRPGANAAVGRTLVKRQVPAFFRPNQRRKPQTSLKQQVLRQELLLQRNRQKKKKVQQLGNQQVTRVTNGLNWFQRKRQQLQKQRRRRQRLRQQRLKRQKQKKKQQQKKNQNKKNQNILNRIRRRIRQDVGGGRIEGLSRVQRDGDAEMQLFGNYTLIRSHMKMGPVEITMQIRTKNGIRRSGATLACIRAHTVTRVNHEGSEMIDYLLDRPHPETIQVRGTLFPLAQRIARNIFARLFFPNSFLVSRLREKAALAYLSKPIAGARKR